ncbi:hypothetical protein FHS43_002737 [Streptosporangium becharense]|uniref:Glycosyltransferase RgtA/B/C/D-like domain-containing protein n=1 Tax=Streptosporangium becharense TaxID=1816182 RepID=A0A7W9MJM0_9ACTN|nr:hypothetical protein [Streptosporangium becharense]MBB2911464.1 hypothetical protein [Streptosporangium becharense]MBB5822718.1 hypothetical protein [Streptosporangium becharense]
MTGTLQRTPPSPARAARHLITRPPVLLALVCLAYGLTQLIMVSVHMGIGWDESIYASQFAAHTPPADFSAPRAQGMPLLVAPVVALTDSVVALRVYLTVLSSLALFGAFLVWTRVRPGYAVPLAAALFAGCWLSLFYGNEAMPNLYVALGTVAATGFFLLGSSRGATAGLAGSLAAVSLIRPSDALVAAVPMAVAALLARPRRISSLAAVLAGLGVGWGEWLIEAELRFGGVAARMRGAGEANLTGLTVSVLEHARALDGPSLCRWNVDCGDVSPVALTWWLAIPLMTAVGLWAAWRERRPGPVVLVTVTGLAMAASYLFYVDYAAPRFLMPTYALLSLPIAVGAIALARAGRPPLRYAAVAFVGAGLLAHFALQGTYAYHLSAGTYERREEVRLATEELRRMGVRAPCVVYGQSGVQVGYMLGCRSQGLTRGFPAAQPPRVRQALKDGVQLVMVYSGARPPRYATEWRVVKLPGGWRARFAPVGTS